MDRSAPIPKPWALFSELIRSAKSLNIVTDARLCDPGACRRNDLKMMPAT